MGKATTKKAEANKGPKSEPEVAKAKKAAKETGTAVELVTVNKNALSTDIGPYVIAGLSKSYVDESKANQILDEVAKKRFDLLAQTTAAIVKAAKADPSIDLTATFKDDKKAMNKLNDQLGLALGFREVYTTIVNNEERQKIGTAKAVLKYFPGPKEDKKNPVVVQKATVRSNFLHMLKKCASAASAIVAQNIDVKPDKETGTLLLTGPTIKQKFGQDSVLLNDKLSVGEGENAKKLKEKPSFTAIAKMGAEAAGKTLQVRKDSRVASGAVDPDTAVQSLCNSLSAGLGKLKDKPTPKTVEALKALQIVIADKLKG
jgi:hypothetical protein